MKRITAAALIVAPSIFFVVQLLHPKEYTRGHEAQQLAKIADSYTRWQFAHFLTFISILLFVFAIVGLAWILALRRPAQGLIGGALGLLGLVSIAGVLALDGFTWGVLGETYARAGVDQATVVAAFKDVQNSEWNLPFYVGSLAWLIGMVVLTVGMIRERLAPAWAGWTFVAGTVMVGIETGVENNVYFIVAGAVLAVGGIGVGL